MLVHHVTMRAYECGRVFGISHLKVFLIATWIANRSATFAQLNLDALLDLFRGLYHRSVYMI